jgi:hypothetical protein
MLVDTKKENLNINKLMCDKKETILVEEDVIVPDSKPDILNAINTSGSVCIYKKEILEEKIKIDGSINSYIMYLADSVDDSVRGINISLDFSENIETPNCTSSMMLVMDTCLKSINCSVINGRKINVKAEIEVDIKIYSNEEISVINDVDENRNIQMLKNKVMVNSLVGFGNNMAYIKDTIKIDADDNLAEIVKATVNLVNKDIKVSYNKVLAKTEAELKITYLTEERKISTVISKMPIVGFVDIQNVSDDNVCDTNYEIKNLIIKPNSVEEHSIYIELEVNVSCMAYEEKEINLIQDLYSTETEIVYKQKQIKTIFNKCNRREECCFNEKIKTLEIENSTLVGVDTYPVIIKQTAINSRIMYEGETTFKFLFLNNETNAVNIKEAVIPFQYTIENVENAEQLNIKTNIGVVKTNFELQQETNIDIEFTLIFDVALNSNVALNIIEEINEEEKENIEDCSLIIYLVKQNDSLWQIAKNFKSTVDDIVRVNGIENPNIINPGEKLYIPKCIKYA